MKRRSYNQHHRNTKNLKRPPRATTYQLNGQPRRNGQILRTVQSLRLNHKEIENMNRQIISTAIESIILKLPINKSPEPGSYLVVQWSGFGAFTAMTRVQSLVWELRSGKLRSAAKNKTKTNKQKNPKKLQDKMASQVNSMKHLEKS